jgi:peptide/nickel transport system substrate-binding protein
MADPDEVTTFMAYFPSAGSMQSGFNDDATNKLVVAARTETDPVKRAPVYKKMQEILFEDAPWVYIANWKQNPVAGANVKGYGLQPSFLTPFYTVYKE